MSNVTFKSLYELVKREILNANSYNTKESFDRQLTTSVKQSSVSNITEAPGAVDTSSIITALQEMLSLAIPSHIITGLTVQATDPASANVLINIGKGAAAGYVYEVDTAITLPVPFDTTTSIFFVNLYQDNITIEKNTNSKQLNIAKIIVPFPGVSNQVVDNSNGSDAYIINLTEYKLHGDAYGNFEEDTIELLRNNISPILADNLIGNIRLSEDLRITNTQGTAELNSDSLKFYDVDANLLAKFTKFGLFFYDSNGIELAKFGSSEARIGNMLLTSNTIQSEDFVEGSQGFRIKDDGNAEFENVIVRGVLRTSVFEKDTISSVGGNLYISKSDVLDADMSILDNSLLITTGTEIFSVGDVLRIKDGFNDEWFVITNVAGGGTTYTVERDKASAYTADNNPDWKKGTAVINYGQSGDGIIYMTASNAVNPYLSIITHTGTPWLGTTERLRLGNLNGFLGYSDDKYGIAIGEATKYLKYDPDGGLQIRGNLTMDSGYIGGANGWQITTNEIIGSVNSLLRGGQTDYATGSGFFLGYSGGAYKFSIGDASQYLRWDGTVLSISGAIAMGEGSSIGSGVITSDAFVDTVAGDISLGAIYARRMLDNNSKWNEEATDTILNTGTFTETSGNDSLVVGNGLLQVPTTIPWDLSGEAWDVSGEEWDIPIQLGEYTYISDVKDMSSNFYCVPILEADRELTGTGNKIEVYIKYSEDNVTWSDWTVTYPSLMQETGKIRYYFGQIVKSRYLQYKIIFTATSQPTTPIYLDNIFCRALAVYIEIIMPDTTIVAAGLVLTDLANYFSKEFVVEVCPQGTTMLSGQVISKDDPPNTVTIKLLNTSNTAVAGTADIFLKGY